MSYAVCSCLEKLSLWLCLLLSPDNAVIVTEAMIVWRLVIVLGTRSNPWWYLKTCYLPATWTLNLKPLHLEASSLHRAHKGKVVFPFFGGQSCFCWAPAPVLAVLRWAAAYGPDWISGRDLAMLLMPSHIMTVCTFLTEMRIQAPKHALGCSVCHWMWSRAAAHPHLTSKVGEIGIPVLPRLLDEGIKDSGVLHARPSLAACAAPPAEPLGDSPVLGTCPMLWAPPPCARGAI